MPAQTSEHLNSLDLWLNNQWSIREEFVIWGCDIVGNIFLNVLLDKKKVDLSNNKNDHWYFDNCIDNKKLHKYHIKTLLFNAYVPCDNFLI